MKSIWKYIKKYFSPYESWGNVEELSGILLIGLKLIIKIHITIAVLPLMVISKQNYLSGFNTISLKILLTTCN